MFEQKEFTLDEVFHDFTLLETLKFLDSLYEIKINLLQMLETLENKSYDAYAFQVEKDLDLVEKNINTFQVAVMAHEAKLFDRITYRGKKIMICNN